jgi:hypothetical protein
MLIRRIIAGRGILVLLCLAAASGCGLAKGKRTTVKGNVTVGGKALPRGMVVLSPDESKGNDSKEEPRGEIDAEGNFTISTRHDQPGATPGWYRIAVTATKELDPKNPYFSASDWLLPTRYIDYKTSGLSFEVVENPEPGRYDLKLDAK